VLTYQVCRFGNQGTGQGAQTWQTTERIRFPDRLDMARWTQPSQASTYVLHSVIEHYISMHGVCTHYEAAVQLAGVWWSFNDLRLRDVTWDIVRRMQASILFSLKEEEEEFLG
jgi:ubiquitin C-terminal hydrolase